MEGPDPRPSICLNQEITAYKSLIRIRIKRDTRALKHSDLLEHRAWIRRIPNPDDRRSTLIEITRTAAPPPTSCSPAYAPWR